MYKALANHLIEITFESNKSYNEPFTDVDLDVIFTEPNTGVTRKVPAFWAGENIWKVRYASAITGKHRYISNCSDTNNNQLHNIQGNVEINAYEGNNPLFRHGALTIATDKRHLSHADGTPFFWLGDTWWMGLTKRLSWPDDYKALAKDRQDKGFTIIQIVAGLYPDMPAFDPRGESESGFPWTDNFEAIRPAFFDEADQRIMHLVSLGMVPCILGCWGYYLQWMDIAKMKQHWRYIMARWSALPVVWVASGEQTMPWYLSNQKEKESHWLTQSWSSVMQYMHDINCFDRLITTHPITSARASVIDQKLVDFEMQQTGHGEPTTHHAQRAIKGWQEAPAIPVINGESRYEALEIIPKVTTAATRKAFWAHLLNSGCAGHTYGANGIWQINLKNQPFGKSPNGHNWGTTPWHQAMQLSGSTHLSLAKAFLLSLPWYTLAPKPTENNSKFHRLSFITAIFKRKQMPVAAAGTIDNTLSLYYLVTLKPFLIKSHIDLHRVNAVWFDPTNGDKISADVKSAGSDQLRFKPPGKNSDQESDWLLVLQTE